MYFEIAGNVYIKCHLFEPLIEQYHKDTEEKMQMTCGVFQYAWITNLNFEI